MGYRRNSGASNLGNGLVILNALRMAKRGNITGALTSVALNGGIQYLMNKGKSPGTRNTRGNW